MLGWGYGYKPDSTGNGALAERAKVCTNVKCPFSWWWGRDRRPQTGRRVSVSTAVWLRLKGLETSPYNPLRRNKRVKRRPTRTKTKAEKTRLVFKSLDILSYFKLLNLKVVEVMLWMYSRGRKSDFPLRDGEYSGSKTLRHLKSCRYFEFHLPSL